MATEKRKSRILDEMHETARGLHDAGLISKRRISEFEALCHLDVEEMDPKKNKISARKGACQSGGFCRSTEHECFDRTKMGSRQQKPGGPSLKLLNLIERKGLEAIL